MKLSDSDVNLVLSVIQECKDLFVDNYILKQDDIEEHHYFDGEEHLFALDGYKVKVKQVGDHRTDGQLVDYTFTFTSPEGKESVLETEMCLMVGWNYHKEFELL